ncbi:asparagine synthetase B, partial [Agathobaculum butyriciproducens]|nr:asparagine synthetase B [Agathobaculum butyriciproducens]
LISEGEQFLTSGDTEVILAGFMRCGPSFIKKLNGIFAITLWDESYQTLHLFRDRLGVKPLFYTKKDKTTIFSSEIKGLFA